MDPNEKDPRGLDQHTPGAKLDAGKPEADLLGMFGHALLAVAEIGTYGAHKYTRGGWQEVDLGQQRYTAAMLRHFLKEHYGEIEKETGLLHKAQVAWNALARLELYLREMKNNK